MSQTHDSEKSDTHSPSFASAVRVEKPWGYELIWAHTDRYVGKILHIHEGGRLSLQFHHQKDETILVQNGILDLVIERDESKGLETLQLKPGESFHIKPGMKHRMIGHTDCDVIEVSTPELDDVVRLQDDYGRTEEPTQ